MITTLAVENYRSLRRVVLPLAGVSVVTGRNGTGKSAVYRSLRLLADAARNGAVAALAREGGLASAVWAGPDRNSRRASGREEGTVSAGSVGLRVGFGSSDLSYAIDFGYPTPATLVDISAAGLRPASAFRLDPEIKRESIWAGPVFRRAAVLADRHNGAVSLATDDGWSTKLRLRPYDSMLSEIADGAAAPEILTVRERLRSWRFYDHLRTDPAAPARSAVVGTRTPVLAGDGSDLAAALQTIFEVGDGDTLNRVIDLAFSGCRVTIDVVGGRFELGLKQPGLLRPVGVAELSDGTVRFLLIAAALLSPRPPELLVLNEPETSMHLDLIAPLALLISGAAAHSQIIVVSHERTLVNALSELAGPAARVLELEKVNGETVLVDQDILEQPNWHWPSR